MMASVLLSKSGLVARRVNGPVRCLATTPRSAATPDPDADDDNILPVRITTLNTRYVLYTHISLLFV